MCHLSHCATLLTGEAQVKYWFLSDRGGNSFLNNSWKKTFYVNFPGSNYKKYTWLKIHHIINTSTQEGKLISWMRKNNLALICSHVHSCLCSQARIISGCLTFQICLLPSSSHLDWWLEEGNQVYTILRVGVHVFFSKLISSTRGLRGWGLCAVSTRMTVQNLTRNLDITKGWRGWWCTIKIK